MSYYAEFHAYGLGTISDGDCLARFDTKAERDEWIERINDKDGAHLRHEMSWEAVTTREVGHRYDLSKFDNDPYGDYCHELNGERTCHDKHIFYITHKPGYEF